MSKLMSKLTDTYSNVNYYYLLFINILAPDKWRMKRSKVRRMNLIMNINTDQEEIV